MSYHTCWVWQSTFLSFCLELCMVCFDQWKSHQNVLAKEDCWTHVVCMIFTLWHLWSVFFSIRPMISKPQFFSLFHLFLFWVFFRGTITARCSQFFAFKKTCQGSLPAFKAFLFKHCCDQYILAFCPVVSNLTDTITESVYEQTCDCWCINNPQADIEPRAKSSRNKLHRDTTPKLKYKWPKGGAIEPKTLKYLSASYGWEATRNWSTYQRNFSVCSWICELKTWCWYPNLTLFGRWILEKWLECLQSFGILEPWSCLFQYWILNLQFQCFRLNLEDWGVESGCVASVLLVESLSNDFSILN